ncbi:MAG: SDR family oxidoreductase [Alphaproteobacteria bacterium]|nr:SDR family oxidoreductase [Alphaproteobacteria bacterium]
MVRPALPFDPASTRLDGKRGLVVGIANDRSLAYGCAAAARYLGARLGVTYLDERSKVDVLPLARRLDADLCLPLDVGLAGGLDALFSAISLTWGKLDFLIHSLAYAPREDLHRNIVDCSAHGFALAMDLSCHSLIRVARLAAPLMTDGGTLISIGYSGADRSPAGYNVMRLVETALQGTVRHLDAELRPKGVRVHAVTPGPVGSAAASGDAEIDKLIDAASRRARAPHPPSVADVGLATMLLATDAGRLLTGGMLEH